MADPPVPMDTSTAAIKSALLSSTVVRTKILRLESIEVEERKQKYAEFLHAAEWTNKKELIGFLPLQSYNLSDARLIRAVRTKFSGGVHAPGRLHPFFGSLDRGVCVSQRLDTVFTVLEEEVDYWVIVCAVAYDGDAIQQSPLFSLPDSPPQAMQWNVDIPLFGEAPGWARHFECIKSVVYAGETAACDFHPRNVLALAVAKVQFCKREGILWTDNMLDKPEVRMKRCNHSLTFKEHQSQTIDGKGFLLEGLSMLGVSLHTRYHIDDEEWPDYLHFDTCDSFTPVFKSWIVDGKLDMQKLLNEGSFKMLTDHFYDHNNKACLHPSHVYLHYYEVEPPQEEMKRMVQKMVGLDTKHAILFGCCPLLQFRGHVIYAAIPPGELANRLGLPTIAGGRFHLIQALPFPKGTFKTMDTQAEMSELYSRPPRAAPAGADDGCWEAQERAYEVVDVSSDSDKGRSPADRGEEEERGEGNEDSVRPPHYLRPGPPTGMQQPPRSALHSVQQPQQPQQPWNAGVPSSSRPYQQDRSFVPPMQQQQPGGILPSGQHPHSLVFPFLAPPPSNAPPTLVPPPIGTRYRPIPPLSATPFPSFPSFPSESGADRALPRPVLPPPLAASYSHSGNRPPWEHPQPSFPSQPSVVMYSAVASAAMEEPAGRRENRAPPDADSAKYRAEMAELKRQEAELRRKAFGDETETRNQRDPQAPSRTRERRASVVLGERSGNEVFAVSPPRAAVDRADRERRDSGRVDGETEEQRRRRKEKEQEEIMRKRGFGFLFETEAETRNQQGQREEKGRESQSQPTITSCQSGNEQRREEREHRGRSRDRQTPPCAAMYRSDTERRDNEPVGRERRVSVVLGGKEDEVFVVSPTRGPIDRSDKDKRTKEHGPIKRRSGFSFSNDTKARREGGQERKGRSRSTERMERRRRVSTVGDEREVLDLSPPPAAIDRSDKEKRREERDHRGRSRSTERMDAQRRDSDVIGDEMEILDLSHPRGPIDRSENDKRRGKEQQPRKRSGFSFSNDTEARRDGGEERKGRSRSTERMERRRRVSASIADEREVVDFSPPPAHIDLSDKEKRREEKDRSRSREREGRQRRDSGDRSDEERRDKEKEDRQRRISAVFEDEDGEEVVPLSPPRAASPVTTTTGFRKTKISAAKQKRTARIGSPREAASTEDTVVTLSPPPAAEPPALPPTFGFRPMKMSASQKTLTARTIAPPKEAPSSEDTNDPSAFVVWHRESKGAKVKPLSRLPPAAVVIVIEDQLIKQMKSSELTPLISMINENSTVAEKRILVVIHMEFDTDDHSSPLQLRSIDPAVLFILDHDGENNNADQLQCCDRLRMRADETAQMIYLTPNISPNLAKNVELVKSDFKIFNTAGAVSFLHSREYEQLEDY